MVLVADEVVVWVRLAVWVRGGVAGRKFIGLRVGDRPRLLLSTWTTWSELLVDSVNVSQPGAETATDTAVPNTLTPTASLGIV